MTIAAFCIVFIIMFGVSWIACLAYLWFKNKRLEELLLAQSRYQTEYRKLLNSKASEQIELNMLKDMHD